MQHSESRPAQPFDLARFGLSEMLRCGNALRTAARDAACGEDAARAIVACLYDASRSPDGRRSCALVRAFVTRPLDRLDAELQAAARRASGDAPLPRDVNCLVLLATVGDEPAWCDRRRSQGHRAIPLVSAEAVRAAPMIARLIDAFGIAIEDLAGPADPERLLHAKGGKSYGVFHVARAAGSAYVPAQREFVDAYGIRSVLGFGAALSTGDVAAVILFSRTEIPDETADRFRPIALELKGALHRFDARTIFAPPPGAGAR